MNCLSSNSGFLSSGIQKWLLCAAWRRIIEWATLLVCACGICAQVGPDAFLLRPRSGSGFYIVDPHGPPVVNFVPGLGPGSSSFSHGVGHGIVYGTHGPWILTEWNVNSGASLGLMNANPSMTFGEIMPIATEDRVWLVGGGLGEVASVARNGQMQVATVHGSLNTVWPVARPTSADTNGRDLFVTNGQVIWAIDTERLFAPRVILGLGNYSHLMMGRDGLLYVTGVHFVGNTVIGGLMGVDPLTGALTVVASMSGAGGGIPGYSIWSDHVLAAGTHIWWRQVSAPPSTPWTGGVWNIFDPNFFGDITTNAVPPFLIRGSGCNHGLGREPRLFWRGLPLQGTSFDLRVRFAEPNGFAAFWFGTSSTFAPGLGALPFDAAPLGAPGCRILASAELTVLAAVDAQGEATQTFPVPIDPAFVGLKLFAQSASQSTGNLLGLASSESLVVRFR